MKRATCKFSLSEFAYKNKLPECRRCMIQTRVHVCFIDFYSDTFETKGIVSSASRRGNTTILRGVERCQGTFNWEFNRNLAALRCKRVVQR